MTNKSENPIYDNVAAYMVPLLKSSERLGSARALLMVSQWISDEIKEGRMKPSNDIKRILDGMEKIRTDILLRKNEK